jgi:hypothetical protein
MGGAASASFIQRQLPAGHLPSTELPLEDVIRWMRSRRLALPALGVAAALTLAACTAGSQAKTATSPQASVRPGPNRPAGSLMLDAAQAGWRLPTPLQRAVALADGGRLRILGGLTGALLGAIR